MKVGETARFEMSPDYGYGAYGFPSWGIPPNQPLIFDIELLQVDEETQM
jgi:peptidylprolyl isomerase